MDPIKEGRKILKSKTDIPAEIIDDNEVVDYIIDLIESKSIVGERIMGTREWNILKELVYEGGYTGSTVNTKDVIEGILSSNNEYIKKYKCLVHFLEEEEVSEISNIGVLYESPGNSATEALQRSELYADKNRDKVGRRFGVSWINEAIVTGFDTYPPRPFKQNLNGINDRVKVLDMGVELEP